MKKEKKKNKKIYAFILFLFIIGGFIFLIKSFLSPYYEVEERSKQLKSFKGINSEKAIGWIRMQGTDIDFPIVYYNDTDVTDPTYEIGWSFSDNNTLAKKTTLFSHNILNVSSNPLIRDKNHKRFEQLLSFIYTDFVKENKYIQYTVDGEDYLYKIYAIYFQKEESLDFKDDNPSKASLKKYIKNAQDNSYFKFKTDVNENDKLITLITCTRFFGNTTEYSFVVDARMVRDKELIKNYGVTEKKSYNRIKQIMEGDEDEA